MGEALRTLEKAMLVSLIYPVTQSKLPLLPDHKRSPKLHLLDTGLMNYFAQIQTEVLGTNNLTNVYQGKVAEHIVGQEFLAVKFNVLSQLNFWVREKVQSEAEVDFIHPYFLASQIEKYLDWMETQII
jgi:predicted AAA+ superfamily ATPase